MMTDNYVPIWRRRELAECKVTLNGKNAVICGIKNDFATIAVLPNGETADFAWVTVVRIVTQHGGKFNA